MAVNFTGLIKDKTITVVESVEDTLDAQTEHSVEVKVWEVEQTTW